MMNVTPDLQQQKVTLFLHFFKVCRQHSSPWKLAVLYNPQSKAHISTLKMTKSMSTCVKWSHSNHLQVMHDFKMQTEKAARGKPGLTDGTYVSVINKLSIFLSLQTC